VYVYGNTINYYTSSPLQFRNSPPILKETKLYSMPQDDTQTAHFLIACPHCKQHVGRANY